MQEGPKRKKSKAEPDGEGDDGEDEFKHLTAEEIEAV